MAECSACEQNGKPSPCFCLGYAYVPVQHMNEVFSAEDALANGSLFPELVYTMCEYGRTCKGTGGLS